MIGTKIGTSLLVFLQYSPKAMVSPSCHVFQRTIIEKLIPMAPILVPIERSRQGSPPTLFSSKAMLKNTSKRAQKDQAPEAWCQVSPLDARFTTPCQGYLMPKVPTHMALEEW